MSFLQRTGLSSPWVPSICEGSIQDIVRKDRRLGNAILSDQPTVHPRTVERHGHF